MRTMERTVAGSATRVRSIAVKPGGPQGDGVKGGYDPIRLPVGGGKTFIPFEQIERERSGHDEAERGAQNEPCVRRQARRAPPAYAGNEDAPELFHDDESQAAEDDQRRDDSERRDVV
jgi:hypothetical protein